jgi:hypothetical protein
MCVSLICRLWMCNVMENSHGTYDGCCTVFLFTMRNERCTPASNASKTRCLEGSLIFFDSGYSGVAIS